MKTKLYQILPLALLLALPPLSGTKKEFTPPTNYTKLAEGVYVSKAPGFYSNAIHISFAVDPNFELYYSFSQNKSTWNDMEKYENAIRIDKKTNHVKSDYPLTTSVDAILPEDKEGKCVSDTYINNIQKTGNYVFYDKQPVLNIQVINKETGETVLKRSLTYLIEDDITKNIGIPVISLSMPFEELMGETNGFYNKIREDIAKRADLEYFDPTYRESFYRNTQIKLGGNWTLGYPQRTLNLNFNKDENGKKNEKVTEHVFQERTKRAEDNRLSKLTGFRLHNGGNAFESSTRINDAVLQAILDEGNAATTGYRPAIVYLNGEYWGLMSIREHYKDVYFENNYNVDKDNVITYDLKGSWSVDEGNKTRGNEKLKAMEDYLSSHDFSDVSAYKAFLDQYLDLDSFLDVIIAQAYSGNWDFIGNFNNLKMWTVDVSNPDIKYEDGKFRFVLHDTDFAFTSYDNPLYPYHANSYSRFPLMSQLLKSEEFKDSLLKRTEELMNTLLSPYHCIDVMNRMMDEIRPYRMASDLRWGQKESNLSSWNMEINNTFTYFERKGRTFLNEVKNILMMY